MQKIRVVILLLLTSSLFFGCGDKDPVDPIEIVESFKATCNGTPFETDAIGVISAFGVTAMTVNKDDTELSINLSDTEIGTYEVGNTGKSFTVVYDFYSEESGTVDIIENDSENRTIRGTFNFVIRTSLPSTTPTITLENGTFLAKY